MKANTTKATILMETPGGLPRPMIAQIVEVLATWQAISRQGRTSNRGLKKILPRARSGERALQLMRILFSTRFASRLMAPASQAGSEAEQAILLHVSS